jgi:hypothetical protein
MFQFGKYILPAFSHSPGKRWSVVPSTESVTMKNQATDGGCKSFSKKVCLWLVSWFFTAIASAFRVPTKTARFFARVRAV